MFNDASRKTNVIKYGNREVKHFLQLIIEQVIDT